MYTTQSEYRRSDFVTYTYVHISALTRDSRPHMFTSNSGSWSCADQFLHFKDDVTCVLLVAAIFTFLVSAVPLMENSHLLMLVHLPGTHYHYLTI